MTDCMPAAVREGLHAECSSGESKSAKRSRRAAEAAREFVADVAEHQTDSEDDEGGARRSKAKVARKASAAPSGAGGSGARAKLPRPEGTAICPRCNSDNTKFCYYNNYNIKQPRFLCKVRLLLWVCTPTHCLAAGHIFCSTRCHFPCKIQCHDRYSRICPQGCQRYWTEGGMLRNVPVGSGRRKSKNTQAREAEKAATADAAKQQSMIATGAFDTFQQMLMNPSLAYSASGLGGAAAAAVGKAPMTGFGGAVVTGMAPLPPIAVQPTGFGGFSGAPGGLPGFTGYPPAKPTDSGRMTAASDPAITALLGGPTTVTTSTVTTFSGGPAVELKGRDNNPADARAKPTDSGAASGHGEVIAAQVNGVASPTLAGVGGGLMYGAGGVAGPHNGFHQSDWVVAAGQMQVCCGISLFRAHFGVYMPQHTSVFPHSLCRISSSAVFRSTDHGSHTLQMAQQQLQQAAALQAQTHLRAAAVSLGQQQNPYLSGMWPYNTYSAGPSWAAAAYARCAHTLDCSPRRALSELLAFHPLLSAGSGAQRHDPAMPAVNCLPEGAPLHKQPSQLFVCVPVLIGSAVVDCPIQCSAILRAFPRERRLGQQQSWQSGAGSGQQMSGLSGASSGMDAGGAALLPAPGIAAPVAAPPMWSQPWSAHMPASAGGPTWGPVGGVPTASAPMGWPSAGGPPPMENNMGILSSGGSMMSGGSNNSTATLLGKKEASLS